MELVYTWSYKRTETVEVCGTYQFDDPDDEFEREPFSICICCNQTNESETETFALVLGIE